ncbi:MOS1T-like protein [Mya arenaria]|uniref:MOS1T-like protein n=1 Tax=Mya arenaria TaxID=6604 RepID=A0ABY7GG38_MYAAR|nr:MOS1T-like protein [Mya arenaria]
MLNIVRITTRREAGYGPSTAQEEARHERGHRKCSLTRGQCPPAHRARYTELELDVLGIGRLEHAPYSPVLAPLDFALFPAVKAQLRGIRFDDLESLRRHVQTIMSSFDKQWFQTVYTGRCVQAHGRYFEKE